MDLNLQAELCPLRTACKGESAVLAQTTDRSSLGMMTLTGLCGTWQLFEPKSYREGEVICRAGDVVEGFSVLIGLLPYSTALSMITAHHTPLSSSESPTFSR